MKEKGNLQEVGSHLLSGQPGFGIVCNIFMKSFLRSGFVEPLKTMLSAKTALVPVLVQQSGYSH